MPWTDKPGGNGSNSNGSGNGNRGPWGQPPRGNGGGNNGGGGQQPDLEDLLKSGRERFKRSMGGGQGGGSGGGTGLEGLPKGPAMLLIVGAFVILYGLNAFYRVEPGEVSVVTTFGKYSGVEASGMRVHFPPVQSKEIVLVAQDRSIDVGINSRSVDESAMLTSDLNIANVTLSVNWKIQEGVTEPGEMPGAAKYVFNVENQEQLVKAIAEAAVREVVGSSEFDPLVTNGRAIVPEQMQVIMQEALDNYESGIEILSVNFDKAEPPTEVIETQLDVINARSEKAQKINVAQAYANREVPRARGEAQEKIFQAQAYEARVVAESRGAASRFNDIYTEYAKAPEVTRQRMYLETVESVLSDMNKIVIDDQAGGTVPYLSLNELTRSRSTASN
ncbi:FtsH protease activity modulator HflK [Parvularcula sp. IMCC14364]|uniref:FtsH protease activity modulator HflK n=1 Tax=Parvularcula sp. IMCC14364 TaxID=3067902 RepID=UPI002741D674|nr:FtsH protease activity modulator HflK [Parvularcula sp. IMCC14364]